MSSITLVLVVFWIALLVCGMAFLFEVYRQLKRQQKEKLSKPHSERIDKGVTYFRNHAEEKITNNAWQKLLGVSDATATRDLEHLVALGALEKKGRGRGVYYVFVRS